MASESLKRVHLMLVEDSPGDVYLVQEALRREGLNCSIEVADNGETAIEAFDRVDDNPQETPPCLLLIDLNVPRKDGTHVLNRLRESSRCRGIPVIMITSSDSPLDRRRALELGVTEYFRKPSHLAEFMSLGKMVRRLLEESYTKSADFLTRDTGQPRS